MEEFKLNPGQESIISFCSEIFKKDVDTGILKAALNNHDIGEKEILHAVEISDKERVDMMKSFFHFK